MTQITIESYEAYFKALQEAYAPLKGFYHIDMFDMDTFLNDLRQANVLVPCLVLETYINKSSATNNYNAHDMITGAILVLDNLNLRKKTQSYKTDFLKDTETYMRQIRRKMIVDKQENCNFMQGLQLNSIDYSKTSLIAGAYMGWRMEFSISNPDDTELDNNWTI